MTIQEFIYQFKLKVDKLDSKNSANIQIPAIIYLLNEGMLSLVKTRYGLNNSYKAAFETIQKRKDELQSLIVPDEDLKTQLEKPHNNIYTAALNQCKKDYMFLLRTNFKISKGSCKDRKAKGVLVETDDLDILSESHLDNSSFEWGEVLFRLADGKVRALTDGSFSINLTTIDYLRYPTKMDIEGYIHFDGKPSKNVECELPKLLHDDIVDEAVLTYTTTFNTLDPQIKLLKMSRNE